MNMGLTKANFKKSHNAQSKYKIVTSWDDGGKLDLRIADLLLKNNLVGTFYVTLDFIGKDGYMNWEDIKELDKIGFEIGSHTVTHPTDLKLCHDEQLFLEIQSSKDMLENALGHEVKSFCYPRGRADDRVKAKVKEYGYTNARGTGKVGVTDSGDPFYLPGTIHIFQREEYCGIPIALYAKRVINKLRLEGGYCNIWGHSAEIDKNNLWETLEEVLKCAKG